MKQVKLRWIATEGLENKLFLADVFEAERSRQLKRRALERMGIQVRDGESPSDAWLRAMCEENGLEFRLPVPEELRRAIFETPGALRFFFWLA